MRGPKAECPAMSAASRVMARLSRRFVRAEDGTITVFAVLVFVLMVGVGGIAIDLMRYETRRVQLQYTLDRAVVAAASLNQTLAPEAVVRNYFETAGLGNYRLRVDVEDGVNSRRVRAQAEAEVPTLFMSLFGQRVLTSPASGTAEERFRNIEVALVLDISGSMNDVNRMENMKPAARDFVTTILGPNNTPDGDQLVSVSIVPYTNLVNLGTTLGAVYALTAEHDFSRCARFFESDFMTTSLNPAVPIQRMAHLDWWANSLSDPVVGRYTCPRDDRNAILPWSNDAAAMHAHINTLVADGGTAIDVGLRWGVALLDPSARPAVTGLVANNMVPERFQNLPAAYGDPETMKILVLMTDGENSVQFDVRPNFRTGASPFWRDPNTGRISVFYPEFNEFWQVRNGNDGLWSNVPDEGSSNTAVQLDYAQVWNHIPAALVRSRFFGDSRAWAWPNGARWATINAKGEQHSYGNIVDQFLGTDEGDRRVRLMCDAAKAQNILIFAIAFEAPDHGQRLMRDCASSDAHYYTAQGFRISDVFASIAGAINTLRLTQ